MQIRSRSRLPLAILVSLAITGMIWSLVPTPRSEASNGAGQQDLRPVFENFDIRYSKSEDAEAAINRLREAGSAEEKSSLREKRSATMREAQERLSRSIGGVRVEENGQLGSPAIVDSRGGQGALSAPARDRESAVRSFIARNSELYGLSEADMKQYSLRADAPGKDGGLSFVYLERKANGIPFFRSEITAAFNKNGELFRTVGEITPGINSFELDKDPGIGPQDAIALAATRIGRQLDPSSFRLLSADGNRYLFDKGEFAYDIPVELNYFPIEPGVAALAWNVILVEDVPGYMILVDANDGTLYFRKNLTNEQTQQATYVVYGSDSPAPLSPLGNNSSAATPVDQGASVARQSFSLIGEHPLGDPWLNDGDNITTGNNVDSGMDVTNPDGIDAGTRAVGAPARVFDFAYNPGPGSPGPGDVPTGVNYRFGEAVNMFFWTNRFHDILYRAGFDEVSRNFQQNNFGRGGAGNDRVNAQGQDASGTDNANFLTLPDGTPGRMQMYIFTGPTPDRSSGLDQEIIIHELTHGVSNRLHGNAAGLNFAQGGGMGEGWGDFYARTILATPDEDINGVYSTGGYSTQLIVAGFNSNYYYGIRRFPYALKTTLGANGKPHNPLTFADVDASKINLTDGAFPRGPIGSSTAHAVHNVGEIWSVTLMEVRARLIALHGFQAGTDRVLRLVTDGMKLSPADPTILQARDAILLASSNNPPSGGVTLKDEQDAIWEGFAARGMGFGASVSAANSSPITVTESFVTPNLTLGGVVINDENCPEENEAADPGETVQLGVTLNNTLLGEDATGVTAEIVGGGSASYGTIAANSNGTANISYTVPADAECGSVITLTINVNSSLGPVSYTYNLQIGLPTSTGAAVNYSSANAATPIPDVSSVEIPIEVPATGRVGDVNVKVRLNHTFDGDLTLALLAPDGTAVPLANNRGGSGDNYGTGTNDCNGTFTVFDDSAAGAISAGVAPFNGSFRPESPLSALRGKSMNGTWKLRVSDTAALDTGTVGCAQLEISEQFYFCCGVEGDPIITAAPPAVLVAESVSPANGAPDPEETVTMSFPLTNVGTGSTSNLVATLQNSGGVVPLSGPQSYGAFSPADDPVARNFTFVAQGDCGEDVTATFALSDGTTDLGTVSFTIRLGATEVGETSGANAASIAVPGTGTGASTGAPANPYPSTINIAGVTGTVTKVTATVTGLSHTFPSDVDMLLIGPGGQRVMLMSDVGGGTDAVGANITFDDAAAAPIGATVVSGTFRPTNSGATDSFPAPVPAGTNGALLSAFNGVDPNGAWSLFVVDDAGIDSGSITGGWSLSITTADPVCNTQACQLNVTDITVGNDPGQDGAIVTWPVTPGGATSIGVVGSCGVITSSPASGSFFPIGTTTVNVTATRADASTTNASFNVTVEDREAPVISNAAVSPGVLWPPNHHMVRGIVSYTVSDNHSSVANITKSLKITSNEPVNGTGDGDTAPDWSIQNAHSIYLRAERAGGGTGRIYTITITATDEAGNSATKQLFVYVPHSQRFELPAAPTAPAVSNPIFRDAPAEPSIVAPVEAPRRRVIVTRPKEEPEKSEEEKPDND